jgi:hypothetical protein
MILAKKSNSHIEDNIILEAKEEIIIIKEAEVMRLHKDMTSVSLGLTLILQEENYWLNREVIKLLTLPRLITSLPAFREETLGRTLKLIRNRRS